MNELTLEEVLEIHSETLARHGGLPGVKNEGFLLSALAQPQMTVFGADAYPTIPEKAAALGFSLAKSHTFHDGNKRVAFFAMFAFLYKNGYFLEVEEAEAIRFMLDLADGSKDVQRNDVARWLEAHIQTL